MKDQPAMDVELFKGILSLLILSLINRRGAMYGYEIVSAVAEETDSAFELKAGSLYPSLHKLEKDGLLEAKWVGEESGRQRKYYGLTKTGRRLLAEKTESWNMICRSVNRVLEGSNE